MEEYRIILTPKARRDLKGIAHHIARDNPERALSYIIELQQYLEKVLSVFPCSGRLYQHINNKEVRSIPYQDYVCIYNIDERKKHLNIVHVFHAARDKNRILKTIK